MLLTQSFQPPAGECQIPARFSLTLTCLNSAAVSANFRELSELAQRPAPAVSSPAGRWGLTEPGQHLNQGCGLPGGGGAVLFLIRGQGAFPENTLGKKSWQHDWHWNISISVTYHPTPPSPHAYPFSQHPLWNSRSKSKPVTSHLRGSRGFPRHFFSSHGLPPRPIYMMQRGGRSRGWGASLGAHPSVCTLSPICEGLPWTKTPCDDHVNFYVHFSAHGTAVTTLPL